MTEQEKENANREYDRAYPNDTLEEREERYKKAYAKQMVANADQIRDKKKQGSQEHTALRDAARDEYAATGDPNSEDPRQRPLHSMKQFKGVPSEYAIA